MGVLRVPALRVARPIQSPAVPTTRPHELRTDAVTAFPGPQEDPLDHHEPRLEELSDIDNVQRTVGLLRQVKVAMVLVSAMVVLVGAQVALQPEVAGKQMGAAIQHVGKHDGSLRAAAGMAIDHDVRQPYFEWSFKLFDELGPPVVGSASGSDRMSAAIQKDRVSAGADTPADARRVIFRESALRRVDHRAVDAEHAREHVERDGARDRDETGVIRSDPHDTVAEPAERGAHLPRRPDGKHRELLVGSTSTPATASRRWNQLDTDDTDSTTDDWGGNDDGLSHAKANRKNPLTSLKGLESFETIVTMRTTPADESDAQWIVVSRNESTGDCQVGLSDSPKDDDGRPINEFKVAFSPWQDGSALSSRTYQLQSTAPCPTELSSVDPSRGLSQCLAIWGDTKVPGGVPVQLGGCETFNLWMDDAHAQAKLEVDAGIVEPGSTNRLLASKAKQDSVGFPVSLAIAAIDNEGKVPKNHDQFHPVRWTSNSDATVVAGTSGPIMPPAAANMVWTMTRAPKPAGSQFLRVLQIGAASMLSLGFLFVASWLIVTCYHQRDDTMALMFTQTQQKKGWSLKVAQMKALRSFAEICLVLPSACSMVYRCFVGPVGLQESSDPGAGETQGFAQVFCNAPYVQGGAQYNRFGLISLVAKDFSGSLDASGWGEFSIDTDDNIGKSSSEFLFSCPTTSALDPNVAGVDCHVSSSIETIGSARRLGAIAATFSFVFVLLLLLVSSYRTWRVFKSAGGSQRTVRAPVVKSLIKGVVLLRVVLNPVVLRQTAFELQEGCAYWTKHGAHYVGEKVAAGDPVDPTFLPNTTLALVLLLSVVIALIVGLTVACISSCCCGLDVGLSIGGLLIFALEGLFIGGIAVTAAILEMMHPTSWASLFGFRYFDQIAFTIGTGSHILTDMTDAAIACCGCGRLPCCSGDDEGSVAYRAINS